MPVETAPTPDPAENDYTKKIREKSKVAADIEYSKKLIQESKEFEDKIMQHRGTPDERPLQPVNKNKPDDWKKAQECHDLVLKIKREKKERERLM